jgi:hypothetical protein
MNTWSVCGGRMAALARKSRKETREVPALGPGLRFGILPAALGGRQEEYPGRADGEGDRARSEPFPERELRAEPVRYCQQNRLDPASGWYEPAVVAPAS